MPRKPVSAVLQVNDLRVSYGPVEVLHGVDLEVMEGDIRVILGANGAGKSTLFKAILGLAKIDSGSVMFRRETTLQGKRPDQIHRLGVAWAPQGRQTFSELSVYENLAMGCFIERDPRVVNERVEQAYGLFPILRQRKRQLAGSLSGGEQQTLSIARALMSRPHLLLLDEPSIGLAPKFVGEVFELVRSIRSKGVSILIVEQNARQALKIADWAYVLENGQVVASESPASLVLDDSIRRAYLGR